MPRGHLCSRVRPTRKRCSPQSRRTLPLDFLLLLLLRVTTTRHRLINNGHSESVSGLASRGERARRGGSVRRRHRRRRHLGLLRSDNIHYITRAVFFPLSFSFASSANKHTPKPFTDRHFPPALFIEVLVTFLVRRVRQLRNDSPGVTVCPRLTLLCRYTRRFVFGSWGQHDNIEPRDVERGCQAGKRDRWRWM